MSFTTLQCQQSDILLAGCWVWRARPPKKVSLWGCLVALNSDGSHSTAGGGVRDITKLQNRGQNNDGNSVLRVQRAAACGCC